MASIFGQGGQYRLDDGRYFVPKMNDGSQFATDMGEKWLTADTWGSPLVQMDMPQWTNNVTRNGGGLQFDIGPMSHYGGEGYVSDSPFATRLAEKDKDPGLLGSMFNPTLLKALGAVGATLGGYGALNGLFGGAGSAAGGAFDMGGLGAAESMGLGGGYTSPAVAGTGGSMSWLPDWAPSNVDMTGFVNNTNPFSYTPEYTYGNLSGYTPGDFTMSQLPGGDLSMYGGGGMVDLGGYGGLPGLNLGGTSSGFGWSDLAKNAVNKVLGGNGGGSGGNGSILGAGLGALAGLYGGGSSPAGTITTVDDLPEWVKPYAMTGLSDMTSAYASTPMRSPITQAGEGYYGDVIGGDYLNANPYLDAMYNKAAGKVGAGVAGYFSGKGRYGSGAHQGVLGESLGNLATDIYGANYNAERARQQQLAMDSANFGNASILQPFNRGRALLSGATSVKGGTSSSPYFRNQAAEILSGALGGSRLLGGF